MVNTCSARMYAAKKAFTDNESLRIQYEPGTRHNKVMNDACRRSDRNCKTRLLFRIDRLYRRILFYTLHGLAVYS